MNDPAQHFIPQVASPGLQWQKLSDMAMHDEADWGQEICRMSCMTLAEAQAFAAADDRITFFSYVKHFAILSRHQVLHAGDAVFFTGVPTLGVQAGADTYEKPAAKKSLVSITTESGNSWVSIQARMQVPDCMGNHALSYLWPGLQPGGRNAVAARGGLQPVLRYCAEQNGTGSEVQSHPHTSGWWVCGQYIATEKTTENHRMQAAPCFGGPRMAVMPGDILSSSIVFDISTKTWMQTIRNTATRLTVTYPVSLKQQAGQTHEKDTAHFFLENLDMQATEKTQLQQCLSLFNIVAKVAYPQANLGHDLLNLPHIDKISLSDDQTTLSIGRMILYSPSACAI